jgi:hypothetical protein
VCLDDLGAPRGFSRANERRAESVIREIGVQRDGFLALGKGILAFLSALAEDERARILARANGGGPPPRNEASNLDPNQSWLPHQQREAVRIVRDGQSLRHHSVGPYHVGNSTIVRALERAS